MLYLAVASALAGVPDHVGQSWSLGGPITDLAMTSDGAFVGIASSSGGTFTVLDTQTWLKTDVSITDCDTPQGAAAIGSGTSAAFYTGCANGHIFEVPAASGSAKDLGAAGEGKILGIE